MIVKLRDKTEFVVDQKRGEEIAKALANKDAIIRLGGGYVRSWDIASVMPGGYTHPDLARANNPKMRLKEDNRSKEEQYEAARNKITSIRKELIKKGVLKRKPP